MSFRLAAAFFAIYFIWGSTYLAVSVALKDLPPFLLSGSRYVFSGLILLILAIGFQKFQRPTALQVRNAIFVGCLLLAFGNGLMTWGMQRVPSGMASIIGSTGPLLLVLISWMWGKSKRPTLLTFLALGLGMMGMVILSDKASLEAFKTVRLWDIQVILLACVFWNFGSVFSTDADMPENPILMTGIEMLSGGILQYLWAVWAGNFENIDFHAIHPQTYWALAYLVLAGGVWGFTSYAWLMRNVTPIKVSAHSFVNPIVALILGIMLLNEPFTWRMLLASSCLLGAVLLLLYQKNKR